VPSGSTTVSRPVQASEAAAKAWRHSRLGERRGGVRDAQILACARNGTL
jgi:hypothetical protein